MAGGRKIWDCHVDTFVTLTAELWRVTEEGEGAVGYTMRAFREMIGQYGPVGGCEKVITDPRPHRYQQGFAEVTSASVQKRRRLLRRHARRKWRAVQP
jgi:hypothetical protein